MELEKEKLNSAKLYRIGYSLKLNKYILAITIPYHIWYERYYEITFEEYNLFGSKELDMLKEQLIVQGTNSERFVFSEFDSENTRKQREVKKQSEVKESNNTTDIREFYVFYNKDETSFDDIIKVNGNIKDEKMLPEGCFVFADDSAGNPICINTSGEDVGSVYFCNQDYEDEDTGYLAMNKVADSFKEFIEKLYILE